MRLNFSELHVVAVKQILEDKYLETICTFIDTDGGSWYIGRKVYVNQLSLVDGADSIYVKSTWSENRIL